MKEGVTNEGMKFINSIDGMFSFCKVNWKDKKITFIRDYFGIKPLYYYFDSKNFILSSELKILVDFIGQDQIDFENKYFQNLLVNKKNT